jgi:hypothetical protein
MSLFLVFSHATKFYRSEFEFPFIIIDVECVSLDHIVLTDRVHVLL